MNEVCARQPVNKSFNPWGVDQWFGRAFGKVLRPVSYERI